MEKITTQELLDLLPIVADQQWRVTFDTIRNQDGACPICAVVNEITGEKNYRLDADSALRALGYYTGFGEFLLSADFDSVNPTRRAIRQQMLQLLHVDA